MTHFYAILAATALAATSLGPSGFFGSTAQAQVGVVPPLNGPLYSGVHYQRAHSYRHNAPAITEEDLAAPSEQGVGTPPPPRFTPRSLR